MLAAHLLTLSLTWTAFLPVAAAKFVVPECDRNLFDRNVDTCRSDFNRSLELSGYRDRCPWPTAKRSYNQLKLCVDQWAVQSWCKGQGFLADQVFLGVHQTFFGLCGRVHDPPLVTLVVLIAPVIAVTLFLPLLCVRLTTRDSDLPGLLGL